MRVKLLHRWVRNAAEAVAVQRQLAKKVSLTNRIHPASVRFIAGADVALDDKRGFGIASHLGLILDKPSIGCAKSRLIGTFKEPKRSSGSYEPLLVNGKPAGAVVRTRDGVNPVFVSPGHKIDIKTSVRMILLCCDGTRIPKPTREADHYVRELKRQGVG